MTKEQVIRLVYNEFRVLKTFKNKIFMWENWLKLVMTIETILVYMQMHLSKKKTFRIILHHLLEVLCGYWYLERRRIMPIEMKQ